MKNGKNLRRTVVLLAAACVLLALAGTASAAITIQTVPVGNAGNAPDPATGFGEVDYSYNIGTFDVTAGQYSAFLNAVATTADPYGLYNSNMSTAVSGNTCAGITQSGGPGSYTYATSRNPNYPENYVSWGDAARFCNWLSNGQPSGGEGNGTTETGSYTLNGATSQAGLMAITRNANADYVIPTENEWYKAAYYNPTSSSYYLYPTQSNSLPSNVLSATGTNNANYYNGIYPNGSYTDPTNYLTAVGAFADSPSPYGTYDQGGDVWQWNELIYGGSFRVLRGGSFGVWCGSYLQSGAGAYLTPTDEVNGIGFRVVELVPEPSSLGVLGIGLMGMLARRRGVRR